MDYHCPHSPLDMRDLLRNLPPFWYIIRPRIQGKRAGNSFHVWKIMISFSREAAFLQFRISAFLFSFFPFFFFLSGSSSSLFSPNDERDSSISVGVVDDRYHLA